MPGSNWQGLPGMSLEGNIVSVTVPVGIKYERWLEADPFSSDNLQPLFKGGLCMNRLFVVKVKKKASSAESVG
jgi:hypothetical protein